jgi:LacI family transcriptional regulator
MARVRLKDVADEVGVSIGAVGRVLNRTGIGSIHVGRDTERRILAAAKRLGYRVNYAARVLRGGRSGLLGIIAHHQASEEGLRRVVHIEEAAASLGMDVMVATLSPDAATGEARQLARAFERFSLRGVDAAIVVSWSAAQVKRNVFRGIPVAAIGPSSLFQNRPGVHIDAIESGRLAAAHLLERGKRNIGFVTEEHVFARDRVRGCAEVLKRAGLSLATGCVMRCREGHYGSPAMAAKAIERLVIQHRVDAIIAENDHWAAHLLVELKRRRMAVPGRVALLGYNDLHFCAYLDPPLTTFNEREDQIAAEILRVIHDVLDNRPDAYTPRAVKPTLIVRQST